MQIGTSRLRTIVMLGGIIVLFKTIWDFYWGQLDPLAYFGIEVPQGLRGWRGYFVLITVVIITTAIAYYIGKKIIDKIGTQLLGIDKELHKLDCEKGKYEPKFFREAGPHWIDFEEGYVHKRSEVDEVIKKLQKEPRQVIEGGPASGKSVLLKYVGYKLFKAKYHVYYIDCRRDEEEVVKNYFKEALAIDNAKTLIIIDNYQGQIDNCEFFLKQYRNQSIRKTKVLIATRPLTSQTERRTEEIKKLSTTKVIAHQITNELMNLYWLKQLQLSEEQTKSHFGVFNDYKEDLWYLSYALLTYKLDKGVSRQNDFYERIRERIQEIEFAEDVFFPLSILNRFEIPMERSFLVDTEHGLGIEKSNIDNLLEKHEILKTELIGSKRKITAYTLHHSSLASLIYETGRETRLGEDIKNRIEKDGKS